MMPQKWWSFFRKRALAIWDVKVAHPVRQQLQEGIPVSRVSRALSLGIIAAAWPQIATNVFMAWFLAKLFRCSSIVAGGISFVASPLQYLLMIPFLRLGETLLGLPHFETSVPEIVKIVFTDPIGSFEVLGWPLVHAILGWICGSLLVYFPLFWSVRRSVSKLAQALRNQTVQVGEE